MLNERTARLCRDYAPERFTEEVRARAAAGSRSAQCRAPRAEAARGKSVDPKALAALVRYHEQGHSQETRRKMSERHRRLGKAVRLWTPEEDELVRTLLPPEAAWWTGRTLATIWSRRRVLGLADGRAGTKTPGPR